MYVRLITFHVRPWVAEAHATSVYEGMLNVMRTQRGFQGMSLLLNEHTREAISLSYWKDQTCAIEAGSSILPLLMERAAEFVDRPPEVAGFELVRQETHHSQSVTR